ncbi:type VII secretion-associated serine protease mycosin [Actinosynnema pretiosum subsp. pretiosum]|uniref:Peptidase S8 and S53 subtilisin kexin sedolisin n=2 Tax=Actinosynnema TaxID=40566 RepID=C6WLY7_ACTMD|nr:type VII secretion-associated serine protease mycosin [Actinosynnema mirum]ACU40372.1 peptidase S8 and S53 subtilisin kexin sedolisin [Actinosynnema mirum DSM 43827]AXX33883.1 Type VII secretion-associated serine protease mycosin [Actinosynnema pretiosum subsp. pretiosum]QUF02360.1 type VII secretion-associated serine protease mycosin [Actinosynnema pretiosum subsp. pretiosum]
MRRTTRRAAAVTAVAMTLLTAPGALAQPAGDDSPSSSAPSSTTKKAPNSQPPALDKGARPAVGAASPDVDYKQHLSCITSSTGNQKIAEKPWGQMQLRLEEAHRFATGKGIKLAVIDTGVNGKQPRLEGRVQAGGDYVGKNEGNGAVDCDGHGTEVAGVAAAGRDPETGFVGAAPEAQILAYRQTSAHYKFDDPAKQDSRPTAGKVGTLARAIVKAAEDGADVINISLTACETPNPNGSSAQEKQLQAAIDWAVNTKDAVIVTAAGNLVASDPNSKSSGCASQNDNADPETVKVVASPPWYADDVLSVASMSQQGGVSSFSVWGPWVSVAAPGEDIVTLDPAGSGLTNATVDQNGQAARIQGTSFAAPYVAGVVAMVRERFPELNAHQVMDRIKSTAQHPGNPGGSDHKVGAGMVNPIAALTAELPLEQAGAKPENPEQIFTDLNNGAPPSRTPMIVALAGTGIGVGALLLTLFVVHTVGRNRERKPVKSAF